MSELEGMSVILIEDAQNPGADDADKKQVKMSAGKRFVPFHPELQRIGFLAFAQATPKIILARGTKATTIEL